MNHELHEDDLQPAAPHYSLAKAAAHIICWVAIAYGLISFLQFFESISGVK